MEEINMFELHLSPVEQLFTRNGFDTPDFNKTYTFFTKTTQILGELIAYDDDKIIVGNAWVTEPDKEQGYYLDSIDLSLAEIFKINTQQGFDFEIGQPYRAELYIRNETTDRPTTWVSCFYRGQSHSGKIMLSIIGKKARALILNKSDIKGFFRLSLDDAYAIEQETEDVVG